MKRSMAGNLNGIFANKKTKKEISDEAILAYINDHHFGPTTPALVSGLPPEIFRQHYYDKQELMDFCREKGISTTGLKEDLNQRIETYLRTGQRIVVKPAPRSTTPDSQHGLKLDQRVINYKSDPTTRAFFAKHIPGFEGFSALVQKQLKARLAEGEEFTYADVIEMHKQFMRDKRGGRLTTVAHDSCQYNQFFIDYKADARPKLHSNKEAWLLVRNSAGPKTYQRYQERIQEIKDILSAENLEEQRTPTI